MVKDKYINVSNNQSNLDLAHRKKIEIQKKINIVKHEKYSKQFETEDEAELHIIACDKAIIKYVKEYFQWGYYTDFN